MSTANDTLLAEYQRNGFLVVDDLVSRDQIESLRERLEAIAEGRVPEFPESDIEFEPGNNGSRRSFSIRKINRSA